MQESEVCLVLWQTSVNVLCENVNGCKLLIVFAKKLRHRYSNWQDPQYTSEGVFSLSIYLGYHFELEFHILAKIMFTGIDKRI